LNHVRKHKENFTNPNSWTMTQKTRGSAHWACIAHLKIEWYWSKFQRKIIITLKNSSHLEWRVGLSDTILKGTHPGTIYAKFGSIWPSCFISQSEKRIILESVPIITDVSTNLDQGEVYNKKLKTIRKLFYLKI
jgi:hypothetical protein